MRTIIKPLGSRVRTNPEIHGRGAMYLERINVCICAQIYNYTLFTILQLAKLFLMSVVVMAVALVAKMYKARGYSEKFAIFI